MGISKASGEWIGAFKDGSGTMTPAHATAVPFTAASRFEGQPSSNPEEMIGAALAGCFSMALSVGLGKEGLTPTSIRTSADVTLEKKPEGFTITGIALTTEAVVPGADPAKFDAIAQETKKGCPVSRALAATPITLVAKLVG